MKKFISGICLLLFCASIALGQSTTMTIGTVTGAKAGDTVLVPINVSNFVNVGSISLQIAYDENVATYLGISNSQVTYNAGASNGKVTLSWYDVSNTINISSGLLLNLKFVYKGGSSNLDFVTSTCDIANKVGQPISVSYNNGKMGNTAAVSFGTATVSGSTYSVPLNVSNFTNVGSVTLKIKYSPGVLNYTGAANQPTKGTFLANASNGELIISWFGTEVLNISNDKFVTLNFTYAGVGQSALTFDQPSCEITDGSGIKLAASFVNGLIGKVPTLTLAPTVSGTNVAVPVNVKDFLNIGSVTLKIKYDAGVLTYKDATNQPAKGTFLANASNGELIVSWFGTDTLNISNGKFVTLNFTYTGVGQTNLAFDKTFSEVTNGAGVKIGATFVDGLVGKVPTLTLAPTVSGTNVTVPLNVKDFLNIGSVTLKIKYDAGVLTYKDATNQPAKGTFLANASNGELIVSWFGTDTLNIANGTFATLNFTYTGVGQTNLAFDKTFSEVTNGAGVKIGATFVDGLVGKVPTLTLASGTVNGTTVSVPLNVKDFLGIGSATLAIKFDPTVLTYKDVTNQPTKGTFLANASNGKLIISYFGTDTLNISNGTFATINFTTNGGYSSLAFIASECEITNGTGVKVAANYVNGFVGKAAKITIGKVASLEGKDITVPVIVNNAKNIGAVTLGIAYNNNVLEFKDAAGAPAGQFLANASNGEIILSWANPTGLNSDSSIFVNLNFHYNGGQTALTFNSAKCEVTDALGNVINASYVDAVVELNVAPVFTTVMKDASIKENVKYTFTYKANDPNNLFVLKYSLVEKPVGATIDSLTGVFNWTPDYKAAQTNGGKYKVTVSVDKGSGLNASTSATLTVTDVNQLPVFTQVPIPNHKDTLFLYLTAAPPHNPYVPHYTFTYKAVDPDGDTVKYALAGGPYGSKMNDTTGVLSYDLKAGSQLLNRIVVSAIDSKGGVSKDTCIIKVMKMVGVEKEPGQPTEYSLKQNYPNPFNPTTNIKYSIPQESKVTVKIFNLIGQEVAVLVNKVQQVGNYEVSFNAANLPSGIYIYRLEAGTYSQVRKMTLLK